MEEITERLIFMKNTAVVAGLAGFGCGVCLGAQAYRKVIKKMMVSGATKALTNLPPENRPIVVTFIEEFVKEVKAFK